MDGHRSRFELPFLEYVVNEEHPWAVCIGVPYGTHIWQVADSLELNGAFKMGVTRTEKEIYNAKPDSLMYKWKMTDIIPIVNGAFPTSFGWVDKSKKAIADRGWGPLNYALFQHPEVVKTKPVTTTNDESLPPSDSVNTMLLESAVSNVTDQDSCTVRINIGLGAAGRATDAIVLSKVKSIGARKARKERREREENVASSGERLTKVTRVTSGALASQGIYSLGEDLHRRVVLDLEIKKTDEARAENNQVAREDTRRAKALVVWERRRTMARNDMTQDDLKVLIQDMKRESDSLLRKVSTKGDRLRPVIEVQCQEREVCLVKGKGSRGHELTHYDLRVLLEVEGVSILESHLLQKTEEELRNIRSTHLNDLCVLRDAE